MEYSVIGFEGATHRVALFVLRMLFSLSYWEDHSWGWEWELAFKVISDYFFPKNVKKLRYQ